MFPASARQREGKQTRASPVACPALILAAWLGSLAHLGRARFVAQADEDGCLLSICPAHWNSKTRRQGGAGVWSINVMLASRCSGAPKCSDWDTPGGPKDSRENDKWTTRSENDFTVRGREDPLIRRREAIKTGGTVQGCCCAPRQGTIFDLGPVVGGTSSPSRLMVSHIGYLELWREDGARKGAANEALVEGWICPGAWRERLSVTGHFSLLLTFSGVNANSNPRFP
jgi:hypothetical protein